VSQSYSWEWFPGGVPFHELNPALASWTRKEENSQQGSCLQQLWLYPLLGFGEPSKNQDTRMCLEKEKRIKNPKPKPNSKTWLAIFLLLLLFLFLDTEVMIHEKKPMVHILFIFCEELSWYTHSSY